jgi:hypothetical protein
MGGTGMTHVNGQEGVEYFGHKRLKGRESFGR